MTNLVNGRLKAVAWWVWLAIMIALVAKPLRYEVDYFRLHGGQTNYVAIISLLLLAIPVCIVYVRLRRRGWYRYELQAIAGGAILLTVLEQPRGFAACLVLFLGCLAIGLALVRLCGVEVTSPSETVGVGFAAGAAVLILVLFIVGMLRVFYWPVLLALLILPAILGWKYMLQGLRAIAALWGRASSIPGLEHPMYGVGVVFLAVGVLCGAMAALSPTIVLDAVKMHLPSAETYVRLHALQPVPALPYSYFPQGFEILMAAMYALGGLPGAQILTPVFFLAFLLVIFEIGKLCEFDSAAILTGIACLMVTPFIVWDGSQVKNDLELAVFQVAALYCCLRWRASATRGWIVLGGILLGGSFAIKHVAVFGAVPLTLLFLAPLWRKPKGIRLAALFFLMVAAFGFYWHVRTFLLVGDPLYPRHLEEAVVSRKGPIKSVNEWVHKRLLQPVQIQLNDDRLGFEGPLRSPMGIVFLLFAPLALLVSRRPVRNRGVCWFYVLGYLLLWASRMVILRYALAAVALLIVLVAAKAKEAYDQDWQIAPGAVRFSIAAALAGALAFGVLGVVVLELAPGQLSLLAKQISWSDYLRMNLPIYRPLYKIGQLSPNASVFIIKGCPRAYAPDPVTSVCASAGAKTDGPNHRQNVLASNHFDYAVYPAQMDDDELSAIFEGWKTEEVYADHSWCGVRITRQP
jgi:hypothetical protein